MKKILIVALACLPLIGMAQNVWERPKSEIKKGAQIKINPDQKYIDEGAIPVIDGKVCFSTTIQIPGKSKDQIYEKVDSFLQDMTTEEGQFSGKSNVAYHDPANGTISARYSEWLVFSDKALMLDRTQFNYQIIAQCENGCVKLTINKLSYDYEVDRGGGHYFAEDWITDKYAVNKNRTKLLRNTGKFRRKTIDRKNYLFNTIKEVLTEN